MDSKTTSAMRIGWPSSFFGVIEGICFAQAIYGNGLSSLGHRTACRYIEILRIKNTAYHVP